MTKICNDCKTEKEVNANNFYIHKYVSTRCKECTKKKNYQRINNIKNSPNLLAEQKRKMQEYHKGYYKDNKEKIDIKNKKYAKQNKEKIRNHARIHYSENKKEIRQRKRAYEKKNKKKIYITRKQWRENNKEKLNEYKRKWRKTNTKEKILNTLRTRFHYYLKREDMVKNLHTIDLIGCSSFFLLEHLQLKWQVNMSWDNYGYGNDKWVIDHIIPCAAFNLSKEEEWRKCFHYSNLQPLWFIENQNKSDKLPDGTLGRYLVK